MSSGKLGQSPWGAILGRPGGDDGSDGPEPGTVEVTAPITGDGSVGTPVGISPATTIAPGSMSAADKVKLNALNGTVSVTAPITGDGSGGSPVAISAATQAARGSMSAADKLKLDDLVANWAPALYRYFLLDYDGGNDVNTGFVDAAAGSTLVPAGLALKTFEELFIRLAKLGAALPVVVLVKPRAAGATYFQKDGTTPSDVDLSGLAGYASVDLRGSTDLTNTAADRLLAGGIQGQAGPGGAGEWTVAGGATTTVFSVASGSLTAEPGIIGMRVRFTGNVTGALANVSAYISANTATQITVGAAITAPAAGDTFFVEVPGVRVNSICLAIASPGARGVSARAMRQTLVGIATVRDTTNTFVVGGPADTQVAFCESTGTANVVHLVFEAMVSLTCQKTYTDETNTARVVGTGVRVRGDYLVKDVVSIQWTEFAHVSATATAAATRFQRCYAGQIGFAGTYLGRSTTVTQCGYRDAHPSNQTLLIGGSRTAALIAMRCVGALILNSCNAAVQGVDVTGAGATGAVTIFNPSVQFIICFDRISGATGNTGVGLDLLGASRSCLNIGSGVVCTVTGTAGDVKLPSSVIMSYVALATCPPFRDNNLNLVAGSAVGRAQDVALVMTNGDGTAHLTGELVRQSAAATVVRAQADTAPHATGPLLVAATDPAAGAVGFYIPLSGNVRQIQFDGAPTSLAIAYVSPGTAGRATTTVPALTVTNQKRRLGLVEVVAGTTAIVQCVPDNLPVIADGLA